MVFGRVLELALALALAIALPPVPVHISTLAISLSSSSSSPRVLLNHLRVIFMLLKLYKPSAFPTTSLFFNKMMMAACKRIVGFI